MAAVKPENRTQVDSGDDCETETDIIEPELAQVFDDLYAAVKAGKGFSNSLLGTLNATNQKLLPRLTKLQREVAGFQMRQAAKHKHKRKPGPVAGLPGSA